MEKLYCGIDLHSNNSQVAVIDEQDRPLINKKLPNDIRIILGGLEPYKKSITGIVVESTFNWYWLVDGLKAAGYKLHLANPAANIQYSGLKYADDATDARWLAHILRIGLLKEGYIFPAEERGVRDLCRKRGQLVWQRTSNILSLQSNYNRQTGRKLIGASIKRMRVEELSGIFHDSMVALASETNLLMIHTLGEQIDRLEQVLLSKVKLRSEFKALLSIWGIGKILGLTIMLETGDIGRFKKVGNYASYCRCVQSIKLSNKKKKGVGNRKNGNKYLSWAYIEAANRAIGHYDKVKKTYQRKKAKTLRVVALKTIASKLCRASYFIMRDQVKFKADILFV